MMEKSRQPRKQRKYRFTAPLHRKKRMMKVHVSEELNKKLGTSKRTALVKKGDKVRVRTGTFKGKEGSVMEVNYNTLTMYVEGIVRANSRGKEKPIAVQPSNVEIIDGKFDDKRMGILKR